MNNHAGAKMRKQSALVCPHPRVDHRYTGDSSFWCFNCGAIKETVYSGRWKYPRNRAIIKKGK